MHSRTSLRAALAVTVALAGAACAGNKTAPSATAPAPQPQAAAASSALPAGVTLAMVAVGDSIFHKASCQRCHGMDAKGTTRAPDLTDSQWSQISGTYPEIVRIVTDGVPKEKIKMAGAPFGMNPRGGSRLTDEQVAQVSAYVYTLSHH